MKETFLIVGANFINKGAQAMLYTTVTELRKRFKDCDIYMASIFDYMDDNSKYKFQIIPGGEKSYRCSESRLYYYQYLGLGTIKQILGKRNLEKEYLVLKTIKENITAVLDISGYALSSQWGYECSMEYLKTIEWAKINNIPVFLLPQSFGPFDYGEKKALIDPYIYENLSYASCIFAREKSGYELLREEYNLNNVVLSDDLVLQGKMLSANEIFKVPEIKKHDPYESGVAIIPNVRNFEHGDKEVIMVIYNKIIHKLLSDNNTVYLVAHSREDLVICREIKGKFETNSKVVLLDDDMDCIEYETFVSNMKYIIASRFHSIVHGYKEGIPCIAIGWAEKYHELLNKFEQSEFIVDVRNTMNASDIIGKIEKIEMQYQEESLTIKTVLKEIQKNSCFDVIYKICMGVTCNGNTREN